MFAFKLKIVVSYSSYFLATILDKYLSIIQPYCVANLSKTLHTNFYQNRSTFAEVMHKSILVWFLMAHGVPAVCWLSAVQLAREPQRSLYICHSLLEMTMGKGFPMGIGIPWDSHGNGNWWQNWEWEWEGMGNNLYGNGNGHYSNGSQFPSADTVLSLQFIVNLLW